MKLCLDEKNGSGNDTNVVAEQHAAQRRDGGGEINKALLAGAALIRHRLDLSFSRGGSDMLQRADTNDEIRSFPTMSVRPVKGESNVAAFGQRLSLKIGDVHSQRSHV